VIGFIRRISPYSYIIPMYCLFVCDVKLCPNTMSVCLKQIMMMIIIKIIINCVLLDVAVPSDRNVIKKGV
jgi:hypothetical protein